MISYCQERVFGGRGMMMGQWNFLTLTKNQILEEEEEEEGEVVSYEKLQENPAISACLKKLKYAETLLKEWNVIL